MNYSITNPMGFSTDNNPIQNSKQGFAVKWLWVTFGLQAHQPQADITLLRSCLEGYLCSLTCQILLFNENQSQDCIILICITNARCLTSHNGPQLVLAFNNSSLMVSRCFSYKTSSLFHSLQQSHWSKPGVWQEPDVHKTRLWMQSISFWAPQWKRLLGK